MAQTGTHSLTIVPRSEWGADPPKWTTPIKKPVPHVFIHHTEGPGGTTTKDCKSKIRGFQKYHMGTRGWSDIGYSFLIGGDGHVYEGRGWNSVGAHTQGYNSAGYGIAFIGNYSSTTPPQNMLNIAKKLIEFGVEQGYISSSYSLAGHRDTKATDCPGNALYNEIKTWNNWHTRKLTKH